MQRNYISTSAHGHPLASKNGSITLHRLVLYTKIGPGPHPCHWCGATLNWQPGRRTARGALCVDHVDNDRYNNAPENLVPACHSCNSWREHRPTGPRVPSGPGKTRPGAQRVCETCHAQFVGDARDPGRYCSRACKAEGQRRPHHPTHKSL